MRIEERQDLAWVPTFAPDHILNLSSLSLPDMETLLRQLGFSSHFIRENAKVIYLHSKGLPLFFVLLIDSLLETDLEWTTEGWHFKSGHKLATICLPQELSTALTAKLALLDDSQRHVLFFASCLGMNFDLQLLKVAMCRTDMEIATDLHRLESQHGIVHEQQEGEYAFTSGSFVEALQRSHSAEMNRAARRCLFFAIVKIQQDQPARGKDLALIMLASDISLGAGRCFHDHALGAAERACEAAMKNWLLEAAVRYGERAVALGQENIATTTRMALVKAYLTRNPYTDFRLALRLLEAHVASVLQIDTTTKVYMSLCYGYAGDIERALQWSSAVLESPDADAGARANALWAKGFAFVRGKRLEEAIAALRSGIELFPGEEALKPGDVEIFCKLCNVLGNAYSLLARWDDSISILDTTIRVCSRFAANPVGKAIACGMRGRALVGKVAKNKVEGAHVTENNQEALLLEAKR